MMLKNRIFRLLLELRPWLKHQQGPRILLLRLYIENCFTIGFRNANRQFRERKREGNVCDIKRIHPDTLTPVLKKNILQHFRGIYGDYLKP